MCVFGALSWLLRVLSAGGAGLLAEEPALRCDSVLCCD